MEAFPMESFPMESFPMEVFPMEVFPMESFPTLEVVLPMETTILYTTFEAINPYEVFY
jgi:hypothetical protein